MRATPFGVVGTLPGNWGYILQNQDKAGMTEPDDWDLVQRAQLGHEDAFAQLVRRYQVPVVRFCERMTASLPDAEDLAQETFVRVYRHLNRLEPHARFSTVLFGIARNITLNHLRDSGRRGRGRSVVLDDQQRETRPQNDPTRGARLSEMQGMLQAALQKLSPDHREIVLLREVEGMEYDEIATVLGCQRGTVKSRLARAREQLRLNLIELGGSLL